MSLPCIAWLVCLFVCCYASSTLGFSVAYWVSIVPVLGWLNCCVPGVASNRVYQQQDNSRTLLLLLLLAAAAAAAAEQMWILRLFTAMSSGGTGIIAISNSATPERR
jgi:hypothetical protein